MGKTLKNKFPLNSAQSSILVWHKTKRHWFRSHTHMCGYRPPNVVPLKREYNTWPVATHNFTLFQAIPICFTELSLTEICFPWFFPFSLYRGATLKSTHFSNVVFVLIVSKSSLSVESSQIVRNTFCQPCITPTRILHFRQMCN